MTERILTPQHRSLYERETPRVDAIVQIIDGGMQYAPLDKLLPLARQLEQELDTVRDAHMANCLASDTLRTEIHDLRDQLSASSERKDNYHPNLDGPAEPIGLAMDKQSIPSTPESEWKGPYVAPLCSGDLATQREIHDLCAPSAIEPPAEPPKGLLVSIALRLDHGLFATPPYSSEDRGRYIEVALSDARKAWEEVTGNGFWSPERNAEYEAMAAQPLPGPYEPPMVYDPQQGVMVKPGGRA